MLGGTLDWNLIGLGAAIGAVVVVIDEILRKAGRGSMPPLAVGMGIYLPMGLTLLIPLGALIGWAYDRRAQRAADPERMRRLGVLAATGLIAGESLFGVVFSGIAAASGKSAPLAVVGDIPAALPLGIVVFIAAIVYVYATISRATPRD